MVIAKYKLLIADYLRPYSLLTGIFLVIVNDSEWPYLKAITHSYYVSKQTRYNFDHSFDTYKPIFFVKFFHWQIPKETLDVNVVRFSSSSQMYPTHLKYILTLPCET